MQNCREGGINANPKRWQSLVEIAFGGVLAGVLATMVEFGLKGIRADMAKSKAKYKEPKVVILLAEFHKQFPNIRTEIVDWMLANPAQPETELREFLWCILQETEKPNERG